MSLIVLHVKGPNGTFDFPIKTASVAIGRSPDNNQVVLDDVEVSRWHARLDIAGNTVMLSDLNSANGTFLNGNPVASSSFGVKVSAGDIVSIGMCKLTVSTPATAAKVSEPFARKPKLKKKGKVAIKKGKGGGKGGGKCLSEIQRIEAERAARRNRARQEAALANEKRSEVNAVGDIDYLQMIEMWRDDHLLDPSMKAKDLIMAPTSQIRVVVRKRPLNKKEINKCYDIASCLCAKTGQKVIIHEPKKRVDLTKFVDHHEFRFDQVIDETMNNDDCYYAAAWPLVKFIFRGRRATCFAYGQTGSGKTWTMSGERKVIGVYQMTARDIFALREQENPDLIIGVSYFEIYGGQVYDLLNRRNRLKVQENAKKQVCVTGLTELRCDSQSQVLASIEAGNQIRAQGVTSANERSSRSHGVFQFILRSPGKYKNKLFGKLSLIDLAGSERGKDTAHADRRTRIEGAEINKSLLALKECIRALSNKNSHTPFRASKLTQVLKDSFTGKSRLAMIATISPADNNAEHTCNTLRYADRVKELSKARKNAIPSIPFPVYSGDSRGPAEHDDEDDHEEEDDVDPDDELNDINEEAEIDFLQKSSEGKDQKSLLAYSRAVCRLVKHEAMLVTAHESSLQLQNKLQAKEAKLLKEASNGASSYDLDKYVNSLETILSQKVESLQECLKRLVFVKQLLKDEEDMAGGKKA